MIWADILRGIMVGSWKVSNGIKITADAYIVFLRERLERCLKKQRLSFRRTIIFLKDNFPLHEPHKTSEHQQQLGFCGSRKIY